ncbi:unnamed protein product [Colias eurytheme]|nr:unnamed protein product [Colias eurytheme]
MRKLLVLYKDCRFLDKLMGTTFFHEDHFLGLLERVKERGANTPRAGELRVHEQIARLFSPEDGQGLPPNDMYIGEYGRPVAAANITVEPMEVDIEKEPKDQNQDSVQASSSDANVEPENTLESELVKKMTESNAPTRNVCHKLCQLIHAQLVKAHTEISRRRPEQLAEFLNGLMEKRNRSEEKLPYHFSVQFGSLVICVTDDVEIEEAQKEEENKEAAAAKFETSVPETAPLATAEGDIDTEVLGESESENGGEGFCVLESAPANHRFRLSLLQPSEPRTFYSAVKREIKLLKSDLPPGVWVRGYEDRIDLLSVMIAGPSRTPYEGGLFVFDVQLGGEYPRAPPLCHYHSYCSDRLNPNLYEDGKVCVSLLGTWSGRGVEVWGKDSSLLQVIVSLQGLILNAEPYFNEAGYEKQKGTQQGKENSRMYNEMVLLKLVQSMTRMALNPPEPFHNEVVQHLRGAGPALCRRLEGLAALSNDPINPGDPATPADPPDYPLVPASRGFCLTLRSSLESFRAALRKIDVQL